MAENSLGSWMKNLAPPGSRRRRVLAPLWQELKYLRQEGGGAYLRRLRDSARKGLRRLRKPRGIFELQYSLGDYSSVTLYTDQAQLFPNYKPLKRLSAVQASSREVSLIATTYNEKASIAAWMESLSAQNRQPDEVVIVDGGSNDGTLELLQAYSKNSSIPLKVISEPGASISRGRNIAIDQARFEVVAATDFGCRPHPDWLEKIVLPFEDDPRTDVVAGWFHSLENGEPSHRLGWADLETVNPQTVLPSSRSIAFTRQAWRKARGYPEWLTLTGEDTYYAMELKRCCPHWAFVPDAVVDWPSPSSPLEYWRKIYNWSIGDGETGAVTQWYWWRFVRLGSLGLVTLPALMLVIVGWLAGLVSLFTAILIGLIAFLCAFVFVYQGMFKLLRKSSDLVWELGVEVAMLAGYLKGARRRKEVTARRFQTSAGLFFILSVVPIDDTGGGARSAQVALELLRKGFVVVYINKFPKYESQELNLVIRHPNLITSSLSTFKMADFNRHYGQNFHRKPIGALVELPEKEFLPLIQEIKSMGGKVIYDLLDDWKTSLGSEWYTEDIEANIIQESDILVVTAPNLAARLEEASGRKPILLPNAVNSYMFNPDRCLPRPDDFPQGTWHMIYIGALWGDWFDWDLLVQLANHYPEAALVVIGDYHGQCPEAAHNLHFLGLKSQAGLPAYLAHADVAIIPWKVSPVTQATSPLKVYEYIAMGKPVIVPDIEPLGGIPGVYRAQDKTDFIHLAGAIRRMEFPQEKARKFIEGNNWSVRVDQLIDLVKNSQAHVQYSE
jgi:glycosyltransferase involved in cell wall biosynthesis